VNWILGNIIRLWSQTALANLNDSEYINRAWENVTENITVSAKDSLGWFECINPGLMKSVYDFYLKGSRLQYNVDNLNIVRREASRHFRNKKKEYLKLKFMKLKLIVSPRISDSHSGINDFRRVTSLELI